MNVNEFADAQRSHYTVYPSLKKRRKGGSKIPFVNLLDGKELTQNVERRWELYHQLHSHFHDQVTNIVENIEVDLKGEISNMLFNGSKRKDTKPCFNTLFLLGSDSTTKIELPDIDPNVFKVLIELTPKESPNVRMMLRRSMFKLFTSADAELHNKTSVKREVTNENMNDYEESTEANGEIMGEGVREEDDGLGQADVSYDLSLVENFKALFGKNLNMIFNFKEVDSINFQTLDNFIVVLKNVLKNEHLQINLVFNINTNMSNIEKNLPQSTIRFLKRNYHTLDVSSNKGFKYGNRIFQSFLDTVDGKLNLSARFVDFLLSKMANNSNHNLQLLVKILDYSLMSYFFHNPFSVFIDPVNIDFLNEDYLNMLIRCPTFMFFVEGLIKQNAPSEEIRSLLTNKDSTLADFFAEFLVRENPINGYAKYVTQVLEKELHIYNYNLIELYYNLLVGRLEIYLERWSAYRNSDRKLKFEPIDTIFQELFTLDNNNELLSQALFPCYKSNLENDMLHWEHTLPLGQSKTDDETLLKLDNSMAPVVGHMFKLYREANSSINVYDFYTTFRDTLPKKEIMDFLDETSDVDSNIHRLLLENEKSRVIDKVSLALFMQAVFDFDHMGIIKTQNNRNYDVIEKCIWRGI
ncbi:origin recognition complex subunit 3 [Zygosaccharomyces mellis]|uniref:Origin recognition complex subunit 3 n=1 Tax=Zygosaccharomyces mellis TaxID=42258 RepID=A0A4C2EBX3_9SACH|nr:origin recognition complex subunit 3 [Zygosaccharomyces mellis]